MKSGRYTRGSRPTEWNSGFTLTELLVAMLLSGLVLAVLANDFRFAVHTRHEMDLLVETQQGLQSAVAMITQELRQAGACLPTTGNFVPLAGSDAGAQDSITLRIGRTDPADLTCVRDVVATAAGAGEIAIQLQDASGFEAGYLVYLARPTGSGNFFRVAAVLTDNHLQLENPLDASYPQGSGVYAVEERIYAIDTQSSVPVLTITIDGEAPQPLARGVEGLDVQYLLAPCPPCDPVDEPVDDSEWRLVRQIEIKVSVRSALPKGDGGFFNLEDTTRIKPRNLF